MGNILRTVSFGVIAFNEHRYLPDLLNDLIQQTYPKDLIEVILVDGESSDDTWQIMQSFQSQHLNEYKDIKILKNGKRIQPAGWNEVINNYTADVLLRIDAHARLPEDFIKKNIECINSGEYVCGGPRENIIDENTPWKRLLLMAEQSMFGAGAASYRNGTEKRKYVKSLFHGAYRRSVIETVGLFDEELIRTEDNEYHYRVRKAGYKICYNPEIHSFYQTRSSLKGMLRQKYLNSLWVGKTLFYYPGCISVFHLAPFAFVMAILATTVIYMLGFSWPRICLWTAYCIADVGMTVIACITSKIGSTNIIVLPIIFLLLHICYGVGTMFGIVVCLASGIIEGEGYREEVNSFFEIVAPCPIWTGVAA